MSELYELPDGWEWKRLDDITELITKGTTPTTNGYKFLNKGINFLKIENIVNGEIDLSTIEMFISEEAHQSQKRSQLKENDVLFSIAGTIGDTAIVKKEHLPINTNQAIALIRPKEILNSFFLKYSLLSIISQNTKDKQRGGAIKNISLGDIKDLMYPLPPLPEQQRIVSKLDLLFEKIDRSIALHQKNMDETNAFMGSILNDVFGELEEKYFITTTNDICTKITDGTHATPKYIEAGVPFLSVKDISKGVINFSNTRYVSLEEHKLLSKRCNVEKDDILYTKVGTTGIAKRVDTDIQFSIFVSIALLKPKKDLINHIYLEHILNSPNCYEQSQNKTRGVANRNLVLKDIKDIEFPLPPHTIQQKTVAYLDEIFQKIEKIKQLQKEKMERLKALKASILDSAFRGEL